MQKPGWTTANEMPGHLSSDITDAISRETRVNLQQQLKQRPLKMPATDAGETSGICNLRLWPTIVSSLLLFNIYFCCFLNHINKHVPIR